MWVCQLNSGDYAFICEVIDSNTFYGMIVMDGAVEHNAIINRSQLKEVPSISNKIETWHQNITHKINLFGKLMKESRPRGGFEPPRDD